MSHFTTVKTEIADLDALKRSLTKAGVKFRINADVRGYVGQTTKAAVVIETTRHVHEVELPVATPGQRTVEDHPR